MIKAYSLLALQKAINAALALDESTPDKLQALDKRVLEIIVQPLQVNFFVYIDGGVLKLLESPPSTPETVIHSSPLGLIRLSILPVSKLRSLFNDKMRISGDLALGMALKNLFDNLDIDWEGHLAHFTGDVIAYQLGTLFRQGVAFKQRVTTSLAQNVSDYVVREMHLLPAQEEIIEFINDVDALSLRIERLEAHINRQDKLFVDNA